MACGVGGRAGSTPTANTDVVLPNTEVPDSPPKDGAETTRIQRERGFAAELRVLHALRDHVAGNRTCHCCGNRKRLRGGGNCRMKNSDSVDTRVCR